MITTTTTATPARWCNTGGDVTVHLVPEGTQVLVNPTQEEVWANGLFGVTTPICELGTYHGCWEQVDLPPKAPLTLCPRCFSDDPIDEADYEIPEPDDNTHRNL